jgi:hypothetical protein
MAPGAKGALLQTLVTLSDCSSSLCRRRASGHDIAKAFSELGLLLCWLRQRRRALDDLVAGEVSSAMGH